MISGDRRSGFGWSWVALALALAVHVADEALNDFLSVWNPLAVAVRERVPWLPLPVFGFGEWLGGLIAGVVLLLAVSPLAFRGARWLRLFSYFFGALMVANGLGHLAMSFYQGRPVAGVYSSPLLLAAAVWLLWSCWRAGSAGAQRPAAGI